MEAEPKKKPGSCSCGLKRLPDGRCSAVVPCPPASGRRRNSVGVKPEVSPFKGIFQGVAKAHDRLGLRAERWGAFSEKGAADSRARKRATG
jgi:hypothetical protein